MPEATSEGKKESPQRAILVIQPQIHAKLKSRAAIEQVTLQRLVERIARNYLGTPQFKRQPANGKARR